MGIDVYIVGPFSLDDKLLNKIDAPEYAVKFPKESGGGYMAILESIHQLHCIVSTVAHPIIGWKPFLRAGEVY